MIETALVEVHEYKEMFKIVDGVNLITGEDVSFTVYTTKLDKYPPSKGDLILCVIKKSEPNGMFDITGMFRHVLIAVKPYTEIEKIKAENPEYFV